MPRSVVVCNRDMRVASAVRAAFSRYGCTVLVTTDPKAAIRAMRALGANLVVIEAEVGRGKGEDLVREIRRDGAHYRVPVILVGGAVDPLRKDNQTVCLPTNEDPDALGAQMIGLFR